jgi:DNA-binding NtrC family response regulator
MSRARLLLIVHPDPSARALLGSMLGLAPTPDGCGSGYRILEVASDRQAVGALHRQGVDLVLAALDPADPDAWELLEYLRRTSPRLPVLLLDPAPQPERSRDAQRRGAAALLRFPPSAAELRAAVAGALSAGQAGAGGRPQGPEGSGPPGPDPDGSASAPPTGVPPVVGDDPTLRQMVELAGAIAPTRTPVLITGERGTGKSLLARLIHRRSPRRDGPLVELSGAALREDAPSRELGDRIARAHGGTLVLDEVDSLAPDLQGRLLRLVQDGTWAPPEAPRAIGVDLRILVTSCEDPAVLTEPSWFRRDLYRCLSAVHLQLPPLRRRRADLGPLAEHFRARSAAQAGQPVTGLAPEALDRLRLHDWPGNVRELEDLIRRAVARCRGPRLRPVDLLPEPRGRPPRRPGLRPLREALEESERRILLHTLEALDWNRQETARVLDINRTTLYKKMNKCGICPDQRPPD